MRYLQIDTNRQQAIAKLSVDSRTLAQIQQGNPMWMPDNELTYLKTFRNNLTQPGSSNQICASDHRRIWKHHNVNSGNTIPKAAISKLGSRPQRQHNQSKPACDRMLNSLASSLCWVWLSGKHRFKGWTR